jgi:O-antigen ligase
VTSRLPLAVTLATWVLWLLVLVPPFFLSPSAKESFRLPKLLASEWLGLLSVLLLAWRLRQVEEVRPARLWRLPAVRALLPVLLVATAGIWTTAHPLHLREALIDLWIGAACLAGWSLGLSASRLERLLAGLLWPAAALALMGILQFHGLFKGLQFLGIGYDPRLAVTSTAGNPGDLAAYLVLPCLIAQRLLLRREPAPSPLARWGTVAALALCVYALAITQTLAALAAVVVGSLILWAHALPRRRMAALLAAGAAAGLVLVLAVPPLRARVEQKMAQALHGDLNAALTGRLDGWHAAAWMLREHPLTGVGQGAFRPEFIPAKLALLDRGVRFYSGQVLVVFANAHNELLEAGAEWGWPGLIALGWAFWVLISALRRPAVAPFGENTKATAAENGRDRGLAWAGAVALALLALAYFPFRVALVAFPALLFLAWVLRRGTPGPEVGEGGGVKGRVLVWPLVILLGLGLLGQTIRWRDRVLASRLLRTAEILSMRALALGQAPPQLMAANLNALRRAATLDPVEVGIPIARGTQFLLLDNPEAALEAYRQASALEPRPEIYLNLGRALQRAGRTEEAWRQFQLAVRLDPRLASVVSSESPVSRPGLP